MSLEFRVPGRVQTSPMSCWWACMAMILQYYGQDYTYPWQYRVQFERPWSRPISPLPDVLLPSLEEANLTDEFRRSVSELSFPQPYEWYDHGLPRNRFAFDLLADMTGFRGFSRPAFGQWSFDDVESRLRDYGPYVFFGMWEGFPHAILVVGALEGHSDRFVVVIDPSRGRPASQPLDTFNERMRSRMGEFDFNGLNPIYYPQSRSHRAAAAR